MRIVPAPLAAPRGSRDDDPIISAVMTTRIVGITPDASLSTALNLMASADVRHLPVFDGNRCRGVLREADVIRYLAASPTSPADRATTPVAQVARPVPSLPVAARRSDAARCMDADMDAVLVTDLRGLVGIVTAADLVRSLAREAPMRPEWIQP